MSRQEKHRGKLIKIWEGNELFDLHSQLKFVLDDIILDNMIKYTDGELDLDLQKEFLRDELWNTHILYKNSLYILEDEELDEC